MNIGHSFKYTITKMIVAWGQPFVIFRSCFFFAGWKHDDCAGNATKKSTGVTCQVGLSHQSFELFNAKQNIPFIILNETKGARSSDRAYVPQICLSLFRHNTYDGVHKKQNVLTATSDHLWSLVIHRLHILMPQELSKRIYLKYHKRSFCGRWEIFTYTNKCKAITKKGTDSYTSILHSKLCCHNVIWKLSSPAIYRR